MRESERWDRDRGSSSQLGGVDLWKRSRTGSGIYSNSTNSRNQPVTPAPGAINNSNIPTEMADLLQTTTAMHGAMLQAMQDSMLEALRGIAPKQPPPHLAASTPAACGDFIRLWGEFQRSTTAVDEGIAMRTCMSENTLATICHLGEFPNAHVPSISDAELLDCLRSVVRPRSSVSAVAMLHRLQVAAANVTPPNNALEVHRHALSTWEATQNAITDANCWHLFKDDGNRWGNWKSTAGKSFSKVFVDALRPRQFRESVKNELVIDDTAMENPATFSQHVFRLATKWPEIQLLVDAAVGDNYERGRFGRGRAGGDKPDRRDQYPRQGVNQYPRLGVSYQSGPVRDQPGRLDDQRGRQAELRGETKHAGNIHGTMPEKRAGHNPVVRSLGIGVVSGRRVVSNVMRVRARSMDIPISRAKCEVPKKVLVIASPALLTSSKSINTTAVAVPIAAEQVMVVASEETQNCSTVERGYATSSEMVPEVVEKQHKSDKEAVPTAHSTAVDTNEKIELAVGERVVDERGEGPSTILGVENACKGHRLPFGLLFCWILAAAACALIGAVLPTVTRSAVLDFRRIDEATPRTAMTPTFSPKEVSSPAIRGLKGEYKWEHADAKSNKQHTIPVIRMRAGAWRLFNNSMRTVSKSTKIARATAVELDWVAATVLGMREWASAWANKRVWVTTAQGRLLPATGIG